MRGMFERCRFESGLRLRFKSLNVRRRKKPRKIEAFPGVFVRRCFRAFRGALTNPDVDVNPPRGASVERMHYSGRLGSDQPASIYLMHDEVIVEELVSDSHPYGSR